MVDDKAHLSVRIPKQLMKDLKIIAIQKDITVTEIIIPLVKKYVEDNKEASEIPEEDWKQFFAPSNPVAGINFGALTDKLNKGQTISERKTILNEWNNISNHFNELYKLEPTFSDEEIKQNLKGIRTYILKKISGFKGFSL